MKNILLIDDDVMEQKLLYAFLVRRYGAGFELAYVDNLNAGIEILQTRSFDAIFIDRMLPPYRDAEESYPKLAKHVASGKLIYISSDTSTFKFDQTEQENPVLFIDKLDMKDRIMAGLLDS